MRAIKQKKQQGFIFLMGLLVLVLGAGVWFGTVANVKSNGMVIEQKNEHIRELQRIKERMLTYTVMQPEIFRTNSGSTVVRAQENIPGPGYFPCPDIDGDGDSDAPCAGGVNFIAGLVPQSVSSRFYTFMDKPQESNRYWYAVDARFLTQNTDYFYGGVSKRFVPLNRVSPPLASLTLDGRTDIVMVLAYAGEAVQGQNQVNNVIINNFLDEENGDGDADFISTFNNPDRFNDHVISITRQEWNAAVLSRVSKDVMSGVTVGTVGDNVPDLCDTVNINDQHWFNGCSYTGGAPSFVDILDPAKQEGVPPDVPQTNISPLLDITCWRNDSSIDENMLGQGWRTDLNCP